VAQIVIRFFSFKAALDKDFKITDLGELKFMLSILITHDCARCLIYLNQLVYIHQVLIHFGMQDASLASTPLVIKHGLSISHSPKTEAEK